MTNIFFKIITLQYWGQSPDLDQTVDSLDGRVEYFVK